MESRNSIPGAGIEPAPNEVGRDFKTDPVVLGSNNLTTLESGEPSAGFPPIPPDSAELAPVLAPVKVPPGPLQKALRDAGLPYTKEALDYLEKFARSMGLGTYQTAKGPMQRKLSPEDFRRAARGYRKARARSARVVEAPELSKTAAKRMLMAAKGITSGRQWKKWKKAQRAQEAADAAR